MRKLICFYCGLRGQWEKSCETIENAFEGFMYLWEGNVGTYV